MKAPPPPAADVAEGVPEGPRATALPGRLDSPLRAGAATAVVASMFVFARWLVAGGRNLASFIVAGSFFTRPAKLEEAGVPVRSRYGYDGQFYYRLAVNPLSWSKWSAGVRFDALSRLGRVGYPTLAWLASFGQRAAVPVMMVAVNVVGLAVLAGLGVAIAQQAGRPPLQGVLIASYFGFLWTVARDLTEITATLFMVAGLLAIRRRRPLVAGVVFSAAVLSRESALVAVGAVAAWRVWVMGRARLDHVLERRRGSGRGRVPAAWSPLGSPGPSRYDLAWVLPAVTFAAWQGAVWLRAGRLPALASSQHNAGLPFVGMARGLVHYLSALPSLGSLVWLGEAAILVLVTALAAGSLRSSAALPHERLAWAGYLAMAVLLGPGIWLGNVGFRSINELFVLSCILILFSRAPLRLAAVPVAAAWAAVAVELIAVI
jgi:hypothetical protein